MLFHLVKKPDRSDYHFLCITGQNKIFCPVLEFASGSPKTRRMDSILYYRKNNLSKGYLFVGRWTGSA